MIGVAETGWLLEKVIPQIRRFVVMSDDQALAVGLWVLHTWAVEAADCAPYLDVSSPTRECGKTRLFEALELVVAKPRRCTGHTEATLFRMIESEHPTLLLDEIDTTFGKDPKLYAGIRGVLDEGHRRGGSVPRMVGEGKNMTMKFFDVFGPKAFAGIGTLPETIASRSIPIRLERKSRSEKVARLRYAREHGASAELRVALEEWATKVAPVLSEAEPAFPEELSDRQWDLWEPLFAVADLTSWSSDARTAAVALHAGTYNDTSAGLLALEHSRAISTVTRPCPQRRSSRSSSPARTARGRRGGATTSRPVTTGVLRHVWLGCCVRSGSSPSSCGSTAGMSAGTSPRASPVHGSGTSPLSPPQTTLER
jgi:hypothetical protein